LFTDSLPKEARKIIDNDSHINHQAPSVYLLVWVVYCAQRRGASITVAERMAWLIGWKGGRMISFDTGPAAMPMAAGAKG
jgi:hypothetical protein